MPFCQVNWIAVVVGAIFNMFLGFMWYGPLFGNLWLKLIGKTKEEITSSPWMYIASMVAGFLSALALALIIEGFGVTTLYMGAVTGAVFWIGIGATATLNTSIFEEKKMGVWLLFAIYQLVVFAAEGAVFAIW